MTQVVYRIVPHDGGWAYRLGDTYSETFRSREAALAAATAVAREQRVPDETAYIEYETDDGQWLTERADGHDRPAVTVADGDDVPD